MMWALAICAWAGFALGTQCRLIPLAATSALIAGVVLIAPPLTLYESEQPAGPTALALGSVTDFGPTLGAIISLIVTIQAFFLAGAMWRVLGPRFFVSIGAHNAPQGARASQAARVRVATACDAGRDTRID
jgi:hypothetical protein